MTTEIKIESGPELDAAVSKAIGDPERRAHDWSREGPSGYDCHSVACARCGEVGLADSSSIDSESRYCLPKYSTDLNAAFEAAEAVELFRCAHLLQMGDGDWVIQQLSQDIPLSLDLTVLAIKRTPALAICAAILRLRHFL